MNSWLNLKFQDIYKESKVKAGPVHNYPVLSCTLSGIKNQLEHFNKQVASKDTSGYLVADYGDLVLSPLNLWMGGVGVQKLEVRGVFSPAYKVFKIISKDIFPDFMTHFVRSEIMMRNYMSVSIQGASIVRRNLDQDALKQLVLCIPPIYEQVKIAQILSSVDEVIELTELEISKLQDLKKGMMQDLLTKGIGHTEFKDSPIGKIPESWEVSTLGEVAKIIDCEHKTAPYVDSSKGYFVARTSNIRNGRFIMDDAKYTTKEGFEEWTARGVPEVGDFIFTREAPAGEVVLIDKPFNVCLGQRTVLIKIDKTQVASNYLSFLFYSNSIRKWIENYNVGTTVSRINMADIKKIPVPLPTVGEQEQISDFLQSVQDKFLQMELKQKKYIKLKKGLMQDLLTGKVRVK